MSILSKFNILGVVDLYIFCNLSSDSNENVITLEYKRNVDF